MVPDLETTLKWRAIARALLRLFGLLCLPAGGFFLAAWLIEGISDRDLWSFRYYYWRIISSVLFLSWGFLGLALGGVVARILLPLPKHRWPPKCPYCKYELVTLREARCPECGRALTAEYVAGSQRPPEGGS